MLSSELVLGLLRATDFAFTTGTVGILLFLSRVAGEREGASVRTRSLLKGMALTSFLVSIAWMALAAGDLAESWRPAEWGAVLTETSFGRLWLAKSAAAGALLFGVRKRWYGPSLPLGLVSLAGFSLTGHAGVGERGLAWTLSLDLLHLLAVSAWWGGLLSLFVVLAPESKGIIPTAALERGVRKFSKLAMASTITIFVTGVASGLRAGVAQADAWGSAYSLLFAGKVGLSALVLIAAAWNHFKYLPSWHDVPAELAAFRVRRAVRFELFGVSALFVLAAFLGRSSPPAH